MFFFFVPSSKICLSQYPTYISSINTYFFIQDNYIGDDWIISVLWKTAREKNVQKKNAAHDDCSMQKFFAKKKKIVYFIDPFWLRKGKVSQTAHQSDCARISDCPWKYFNFLPQQKLWNQWKVAVCYRWPYAAPNQLYSIVFLCDGGVRMMMVYT